MNHYKHFFSQLILPVLFAAIAGVAVALLVGGVDVKGIGEKIGKSVSGLSNLSSLFNLSNHSTASSPSSSDFVAIYMENGKVYFGKMQNSDSDEPRLTDVFTLNVNAGQDAAQAEFELVKLTDQFQAPTDLLVLSRNKILFWEPLKSDSRVAEAIGKYKSQK
ncbi:hypothetical protein HZB78_03765 [Candidatus Collierbacteria bacterium]|nr:hypothetical protein [Candidatus Collierbacteria bacterium]